MAEEKEVKMAESLIMMAVYNGEKYLGRQIDSILAQTCGDWELIVQDDGSTDGTRELLETYSAQDSRITWRPNETGFHGAYCNFHSLANHCKELPPHTFYLFADQDDEWMPDKLERMKELLSGVKKPALAFADMDVIDGEGNPVFPSVGEAMGCRYVNKSSLFFSHIVFGCNTIMNDALFRAVPEIDVSLETTKILSHDNLYAKFAAALGRVIYSPEVTMHYRRHGDNVTAGQKYNYGPARILERAQNLKRLAKDHALTYNQSLCAIALLAREGHEGPALREIRHALCCGGPQALKIVQRRHVSWGKPVKDASRKLILLSGMYKPYLLPEFSKE